jgi:hypothetical protein
LVNAYTIQVGDHVLFDPANTGLVEFEVVAIEVFMTAKGGRKLHYRWSGFGPEPAVKRFAANVADATMQCWISAPDYSADCTARDKHNIAMALPPASPAFEERPPLTSELYEDAYDDHQFWLLKSPLTSQEEKDAIKTAALNSFLLLRPGEWEREMQAQCQHAARGAKEWKPLPLFDDEKPPTQKGGKRHAKPQKSAPDAGEGQVRADQQPTSDCDGED